MFLEILVIGLGTILAGVALFYTSVWCLLHAMDWWVNRELDKVRLESFMESHRAWGLDGQLACESCFKKAKNNRYYHQLVGMFSTGEPDYAVVCGRCWTRE